MMQIKGVDLKLKKKKSPPMLTQSRTYVERPKGFTCPRFGG